MSLLHKINVFFITPFAQSLQLQSLMPKRAFVHQKLAPMINTLRLAHSCILARVLLHTGACADAALLTYLLTHG